MKNNLKPRGLNGLNLNHRSESVMVYKRKERTLMKT